jgi:hypothetical protein
VFIVDMLIDIISKSNNDKTGHVNDNVGLQRVTTKMHARADLSLMSRV